MLAYQLKIQYALVQYNNYKGTDSKNVEINKRITKIKAEIDALDKILTTDQYDVNRNGGSKVGLVIGLILTIGSVLSALVYIYKNKQTRISDFDEGGEAEGDFYYRV